MATYRVTRFCCTSGHCDTCQSLPRGQRVRVTHINGQTLENAARNASMWRAYAAKVEVDAA